MWEQQTNGKRVDGIFMSAVNINMIAICQENLGVALSKDTSNNRIKPLKNNFTTAYGIFNKQVAFKGPNPRGCSLQLKVWDELIKVFFL